MYSSIIPLISLLTVAAGIEITPLTLANSVIFVEGKTKCVPIAYEAIRGRVKFGRILQNLQTKLDAVKIVVGMYGSKSESEETRAYRICEETRKVDGEWLLDSVINISGSQDATLRFRVIELQAAIRLKLEIFVAEWDAYPLGLETPVMPFTKNELEKFEQWPYVNQDSSEIIREERVGNTFYPKVSPGIISRINFVEGIAKPGEVIRFATNLSDPQFLEIWHKLSDQMAIAESQLKALISSAKLELSKGTFPSIIFPFDEWILAWNGLSSTPLS